MGCGCNKGKRVKPTVTSSKSPPTSSAKSPTPAATATGSARTSATTARTTSYVLQMASGHIQRYRTQLEAEAARVRFGGDGTIRER